MKSNNRFQAGSGVYTCRCCGHRTRATGGDGAGVQLCDLCFDLAGWANVFDNDEVDRIPEHEVVALAKAIESKGGKINTNFSELVDWARTLVEPA